MSKPFPNPTIRFALVGGLALLAACKSTGNQGVEQTSTRMTELRAKVEELRTNVNAAATSLASLVDAAESDPKPNYDRFSKDAKAVASSYDAAASRLAKVKSGAETLFADWAAQAKELSDPRLQEASAERREDLKETLDEVVQATEAALAETKTFVATAKDVQKYLSQDLTPAGIQAVEKQSKEQSKAAASISDKLDDVIEAAGEAAEAFATAKPPPPPPKS